MELDVDTLVTEVLTLAILAPWQPDRSERAFLGDVCRHWRAYFPALLNQGACDRRARDLLGVLAALGPAIARHLAARLELAPPYAILDSVPVPPLRRCRGLRLFAEEAGLGHGGSGKRRVARHWRVGSTGPPITLRTGRHDRPVLSQPLCSDPRGRRPRRFRWPACRRSSRPCTAQTPACRRRWPRYSPSTVRARQRCSVAG